jgi:type IV secretory pathway VirB10-like protein
MRIRSVLTTAASVLLASTVFAAAQGTQKQGPGGEGSPAPAQTQQHEGQQGKQAPQKGERRENGSQKGAQAQEREGSGKQQQGKQETQKEQRGEPKDKGERNDAAQRNERNERNDATQRGERNDAQRGERNDGQRGEQRTGDAGHKTLTLEQKTKVRETVLRGGSAPRVTSVNFTVSVGTVVPTTVRVVELPPVLIEYYPDWRGYLYFVYNDEIIVVDRNHRIIAVLEV